MGGECLKWVCPGNVGVPDRIVIVGGCTELVELKRLGGKVEMHQTLMHERLGRAGARVFVVEGIQGVEQYLAGLRQRVEEGTTHA